MHASQPFHLQAEALQAHSLRAPIGRRRLVEHAGAQVVVRCKGPRECKLHSLHLVSVQLRGARNDRCWPQRGVGCKDGVPGLAHRQRQAHAGSMWGGAAAEGEGSMRRSEKPRAGKAWRSRTAPCSLPVVVTQKAEGQMQQGVLERCLRGRSRSSCATAAGAAGRHAAACMRGGGTALRLRRGAPGSNGAGGAAGGSGGAALPGALQRLCMPCSVSGSCLACPATLLQRTSDCQRSPGQGLAFGVWFLPTPLQLCGPLWAKTLSGPVTEGRLPGC